MTKFTFMILLAGLALFLMTGLISLVLKNAPGNLNRVSAILSAVSLSAIESAALTFGIINVDADQSDWYYSELPVFIGMVFLAFAAANFILAKGNLRLYPDQPEDSLKKMQQSSLFYGTAFMATVSLSVFWALFYYVVA